MDYQLRLEKLSNNQPKSLTDLITETLRSAILEGEFAAGQKLTTGEIRDHFNVSRMPVREALRKLESEGLVDIVPQKGSFVAEISIKELKEIIVIRKGLEKLAVEEAYKKASKEDYRELDKIIDKQIEEEDKIASFKLGSKFHNKLYGLCSNHQLMELIHQIRGKFNRYLRLHASMVMERENANQHRDILTALENDKLNEALALLEQHINGVGDEIIKILLDKSEED